MNEQMSQAKQTEELKPGRELDARIAVGLMGWKNIATGSVTKDQWGEPPEPSEHGRRVPYYSTYDGDAVEVLNKLADMGCDVDVSSDDSPKRWACHIGAYEGLEPVIDVFGTHKDFAMAVCEAAVKFIAASNARSSGTEQGQSEESESPKQEGSQDHR